MRLEGFASSLLIIGHLRVKTQRMSQNNSEGLEKGGMFRRKSGKSSYPTSQYPMNG